jgi:AcrR family transcriptional regulator
MTPQAPSASPARSEAAAEARKQQILMAAADLIADKGFAATRVGDIARRAKVSHGLVNFYFGSLENLLIEALLSTEERFYQVADTILRQPTSGAERLRRLVEWVFSEDSRQTRAWTLWLESWAEAAHRDVVADARARQDERWRTLFDNAVSDDFPGSEEERESAILTLAALLDGLMVQVALEDPTITTAKAYELGVRYTDRMMK